MKWDMRKILVTPIQQSKGHEFRGLPSADWFVFIKRAKIVQKMFPSIFKSLRDTSLGDSAADQSEAIYL